MMDSFKEDIVSPRNGMLGSVLYVLCWVFTVVFALYGLLLLQVLLFAVSVGTLAMAVLSFAAAVLIFFPQGSVQGGV